MDWYLISAFIKEEFYWLIPSLTSFIFTLVTILLIIYQARWQKIEKKKNFDFLLHQNNLQETQICVDLMEKRLIYYQCFRKAIIQVIRDAQSDGINLQDFRVGTFGIELYFGEDIVELQEKLDSMLKEMWKVSMKVNTPNTNDQDNQKQSASVDSQDAMLTEFKELNDKLKLSFAPYLDFSKYRIKD